MNKKEYDMFVQVAACRKLIADKEKELAVLKETLTLFEKSLEEAAPTTFQRPPKHILEN